MERNRNWVSSGLNYRVNERERAGHRVMVIGSTCVLLLVVISEWTYRNFSSITPPSLLLRNSYSYFVRTEPTSTCYSATISDGTTFNPSVLLSVKNFQPRTPLRGSWIVARTSSLAPGRHVWPPSVMRVATPRGSRIPGIPNKTTLNYYISCLYQSRTETVGYCEPPPPGMMNCNCHVTSI